MKGFLKAKTKMARAPYFPMVFTSAGSEGYQNLCNKGHHGLLHKAFRTRSTLAVGLEKNVMKDKKLYYGYRKIDKGRL